MKPQMNLGQIIDTLRRHDPGKDVYYDFVHFRPEGIHSYRGYYEQLALGYGLGDITVGQLLGMCEGAVGKSFTGYKGGEYVMGRETPVWVANHNESGGTGIVGVEDRDWRILLVTAAVDSY